MGYILGLCIGIMEKKWKLHKLYRGSIGMTFHKVEHPS